MLKTFVVGVGNVRIIKSKITWKIERIKENGKVLY